LSAGVIAARTVATTARIGAKTGETGDKARGHPDKTYERCVTWPT
jgi:hypothetical protein